MTDPRREGRGLRLGRRRGLRSGRGGPFRGGRSEGSRGADGSGPQSPGSGGGARARRRARLLHHGSRLLLILSASAAVPFLFPRSPLPSFGHIEEGMVAEEDVIARFAFPVRKSPERLAAERREAEATVPPVFTLSPEVADSSLRRVERFFVSLDSALAAEGVPDTVAARRVLARFGVRPASGQVEVLAGADLRGTLRRSLERALDGRLREGAAPPSDLEEVVPGGTVLVRGGGADRRLPADSLRTMGDFFQRVVSDAPERLGAPGIQLLQVLLVRFAEPSLRLDRAATRAAREQAVAAVEESSGQVLQGERIVTAHERVGAEEMERLDAYREELRRRGLDDGTGVALRALGAGLHALVLLGLLTGVLLLFRPEIYRDPKGFGIVFGLLLLLLVAGRLAQDAVAPETMVPVAFLALLVAALYDGLLALVTVVVLAGLLAGQPAFDGVDTVFLVVVAGAAAALGVRRVRRRSDSWILMTLVAGAYLVGGGALALMQSLPLETFLRFAGLGTANAVLSTLLVVGAALPALEAATGITTEQTLLELSDLNRPLLRRLSREAPGTYAHSVNVANLAEAACNVIEADALLARAGAYYHDIGKMARPQFFVENQPAGRNPHDRIPPLKSAEVILGHVEEGVRMAREARLPECLRAFIREHHGTTTVQYFLDKARKGAKGEEPDPASFTYPGPRPRSRETAIVMLADGIESTSRLLTSPTGSAIRELVDGIVDARLEEEQLAEAPLTLRDLERVRQAFVRVLMGMYHRRIEYPDAPARSEEPAADARPDPGPRSAGDLAGSERREADVPPGGGGPSATGERGE